MTGVRFPVYLGFPRNFTPPFFGYVFKA